VLVVLLGLVLGRILVAGSVLASAFCLWRKRVELASSARFGGAFGLVLALTVVIVPMSALYNQVLLAPAILALVESQSSGAPVLRAVRLGRVAGGILLVWPWIATLGLSVTSVWLTPELRQRLWLMPLYSSLMLPILVFALLLLDIGMIQPHNLRGGAERE